VAVGDITFLDTAREPLRADRDEALESATGASLQATDSGSSGARTPNSCIFTGDLLRVSTYM